MAPPVYEPDEAGEAPTARLGKRLGEDSQTQRHDSVSSVGERNVLAATSAGRVEMGKSGGTGLLVGRSNSSQAGGLSLGFANEPSVFARGSEPSTTQAQQPASVANHHASPQYFGGHGGARQSNSSRTTWSLADFRVGERVGASRLSAVYHAMHKSTGMDIALKCYLRDRLDAFSLAQIKREVSIHAKLAHPAVVPFYGSFEDERGNIYLLHEYARGGDVFSLLNKSGGAFSEAQTCGQILHPVASAVAYLHARGITHRDIKPENLLVGDSNAAAKVTDFGFAMDFTQNQCKTRLGTTDYMAPEIVRCDKAMRDRLRAENRSGYGPEVDCWAVGVLAYECLVGAAPFEGGGTNEVYARILTGKYHLPDRFTPEAVDFIAKALDPDPRTRMSAEQMLRHPWITRHCEPKPDADAQATDVDAEQPARRAGERAVREFIGGCAHAARGVWLEESREYRAPVVLGQLFPSRDGRRRVWGRSARGCRGGLRPRAVRAVRAAPELPPREERPAAARAGEHGGDARRLGGRRRGRLASQLVLSQDSAHVQAGLGTDAGVHIQRGVRGGRWKHVRRGDVPGWVQVAERQQPVGAAPHGGNRGRLGPDDGVKRLRGGGSGLDLPFFAPPLCVERAESSRCSLRFICKSKRIREGSITNVVLRSVERVN